ncbi:MAG: hypothetical protein AVDCRST_MAG19-1523, partial [uncultured Thermomicrobiales bacterium]
VLLPIRTSMPWARGLPRPEDQAAPGGDRGKEGDSTEGRATIRVAL